MSRLLAVLAILGLVSVGASTAPAAVAAPTESASAPDRHGLDGKTCSKKQAGNKRYRSSRPHFSWTLFDKRGKENFSGAPRHLKVTITTTKSRTNSVSVSSSVSASVSAGMFAEVNASVSADIGQVNDTTSTKTVEERFKLKSGDRYFFASGIGTYRARAKAFACIRVASYEKYEWRRIARGRVAAYTVYNDTVVGCKRTAHRRSLSRAIQRAFC